MPRRFILFVGFISSSLSYADFNGRVVGISDGDTITVLDDQEVQHKIRMANIDAPESKQPFGQKSKLQLSSLIFNKRVFIQERTKDRYNRTIATVSYDKININQAMVLTGYAWVYREYLDDSFYLQLEQKARTEKRGLWVDPNPVYPATWRKQQ